MFTRGRIEPQPGQESVWDYPRPPRVEPSPRHVQVVCGGVVIAETRHAQRVLETSHPPVYYIPPADVRLSEHFVPSQHRTWCEFKGTAHYYTMVVDGRREVNVAWTYPDPAPGYEEITDHIALYPGRMDACYVDGEQVQAQPGDFYGGWITRNIVGPFKGGPGTRGW